jgi:hypothetical protein
MSTLYTPLLGYALPTTGELDGTWGNTVNNSITQLVEDSVAGYATADVTSGDWTLTTTGSGVANQARNAILIATGTPAVARNIIAPAKSKLYYVINESSKNVTIKASSTTGATVVPGQATLVGWDGFDFAQVVPDTALFSNTADYSILAGTANTTINLSGGAASRIPYQTAAGVTAFLPNGTSGQILTSQGASAPIWSSIAGGISLSGNNTWTGIQTFIGTTSTKAMQVLGAAETVNIVAGSPSSTTNILLNSGGVHYYTVNATVNWVTNLTYSGSTSLNTVMSVGDSMTVAVLTSQGSVAYYNSSILVDGNAVTPKWQGGSAPVAGNTSGIDVYTYTIIKTASATFTVLASQTQFK